MKFDELKIILIRLYKEYVKKHLKKILIALVLSLIVAGSTSSIAWLLDPAVKKIFIEQNKVFAWSIPILIVVAFSSKGLSLYFARINIIRVGEEVAGALQKKVANNILTSDIQTLDNRHSGKYISNIMYDTHQVQNLVSTGVLNLMKDTFSVIALVSLMFYQNWKLALFAILMMPLAAGFAKSLGKRIGKAVGQAGELSGKLTSFLSEIFKGSKMIRIYQKEDEESKNADRIIYDLVEKNIKINSVLVRATPIMETLTGFMIAGFIFFSGKLIAAGELEVNNFFSFLAAMMLAYQPVRALSTINMVANQGLSASARILPIIDQKNKITNILSAKPLTTDKAEIIFNNLNFSYDIEEAKTLKNISLKFEGGKMTSLVGHSGSGKSTILNLIPRFYDPESGDITIDDQSIYKSTIESLRNEVSMVSQETTLFDDTIKNNIKYAKADATDEEIQKVAKLSFCEEFINKLPDKFDTLIGENGVRLSGGEKQRLSIARAMLKESSIILLDEATSSLDSETETKIQKALKILTENKTTVVIAHRLSTILNSNNIYVIDNGKVADSGNHDDLLIKSPLYKNFYEKQIQK